MPKDLIDITGKKFGRWTVLKYVGGKWMKWNCVCECGARKDVSGASLRMGLSLSCGCLKKERSMSRGIDITGERFGALVVKNKTGSKKLRSIFLCLCDCGKQREFPGVHLRKGWAKSCGCKSHVRAKEGKCRFDSHKEKLYKYHETRRSPDGNTLEVKCHFCGKWFEPSSIDVSNRIAAISGRVSGENNLYCSDTCKSSCSVYRKSSEVTGNSLSKNRLKNGFVRSSIISERGNTCEICGSVETLHVHHINPFSMAHALEHDKENCLLVCVICHNKLHKLPGCGKRDLRCKKGAIGV